MSGRKAAGPAAHQRRLDRALGAALVTLAVPATMAAAPPAMAEAPRFRAPTGPLVLTREVRRALADGQELVVRRRYLVHFAPAADGWTVIGDLAGVEVEAPADLAEMAQVERARPDAGLFPLQLDRAGLIVARPDPAATVDAARSRAAISAYLARTDLSETERAQASAMAARLQSQGQAAGNAWPADLFRPLPGARSEQRDIVLPDGRTGRVVVRIEAADGVGGLLSHMERQTVTELDGTRRLSLERWTLADAR